MDTYETMTPALTRGGAGGSGHGVNAPSQESAQGLAERLVGEARELVEMLAEIDRRTFGAAPPTGMSKVDVNESRGVAPVVASLHNLRGQLVEARNRAVKLLEGL